MKIALIQMKVGMDKDKNLEKARRMVLQAGREGARIAVLPEMFCCPYANEYFPKFAEPVGGHIYTALSEMARDAGVTLVGGSFPEEEDASLETSGHSPVSRANSPLVVQFMKLL